MAPRTFLTLPTELRLEIYERYFESLELNDTEIINPVGFTFPNSSTRDTHLLHICGQVRDEAAPLLTRHVETMHANAEALAAELTVALDELHALMPAQFNLWYEVHERRSELERHARGLARQLEFLRTNKFHEGKGVYRFAGCKCTDAVYKTECQLVGRAIASARWLWAMAKHCACPSEEPAAGGIQKWDGMRKTYYCTVECDAQQAAALEKKIQAIRDVDRELKIARFAKAFADARNW